MFLSLITSELFANEIPENLNSLAKCIIREKIYDTCIAFRNRRFRILRVITARNHFPYFSIVHL